MSFTVIIDVLFRWLHVIAACLAIGGVFFMRVVLPVGTGPLDAEAREGVFLRCRRAFKMVVHPCILVFLVTGAYNAWANWGKYGMGKELGILPITHGLLGMHLLLALVIIGISLWLLAGREPRRSHVRWLRVNLLLMFLAVAAASSLKWVRDYTVANASNGVTVGPRRPGTGRTETRPATTAPSDAAGANGSSDLTAGTEAGR